MIDLQEIEDEIARLEHGKTTYSACERLAILYMVQDRLKKGDDPVMVEKIYPRYSYDAGPSSEFLDAAMSAPQDGLLKILDEHMSAIQAVYPKEYDAVIRMIKEL